MATVFKKTNPNGKESPFWYGSIKRADGTWIKKSTKQRDRNKALGVALAWQEAEREAGSGSLTHQRTLEILNETLRRTGEKSIEVTRARQWLEDWLKNKEATTSPSTVKEYRIAVNGFLKHLDEKADLSLEAIRPGDVREWREMLRLVKKLNPTTINNRVKILRMPFELAREQGILRVNPASGKILAPLPVTERMEKGTFTAEQVKGLLSAADNQWGGVIRLAFFTGARLRDLTNLRWKSIDLEKGTINFQPFKTARRGKKMLLPIHPDLEKWLLDQPTSDSGATFLFPDLAERSTGGRQGLSYDFQKIMTAAGIKSEYEYRDAEGSGRQRIKLSFHSLRHAFNSFLANAGVSQEIRQKLTGHASAEMNNLYTHHEMKVLLEATKKLPGIS
jgi:integrase